MEIEVRLVEIFQEYTLDKGDAPSKLATDSLARSPYTGMSQFLPTTRKIQQFSEGKEPPVRDK